MPRRMVMVAEVPRAVEAQRKAPEANKEPVSDLLIGMGVDLSKFDDLCTKNQNKFPKLVSDARNKIGDAISMKKLTTEQVKAKIGDARTIMNYFDFKGQVESSLPDIRSHAEIWATGAGHEIDGIHQRILKENGLVAGETTSAFAIKLNNLFTDAKLGGKDLVEMQMALLQRGAGDFADFRAQGAQVRARFDKMKLDTIQSTGSFVKEMNDIVSKFRVVAEGASVMEHAKTLEDSRNFVTQRMQDVRKELEGKQRSALDSKDATKFSEKIGKIEHLQRQTLDRLDVTTDARIRAWVLGRYSDMVNAIANSDPENILNDKGRVAQPGSIESGVMLAVGLGPLKFSPAVSKKAGSKKALG